MVTCIQYQRHSFDTLEVKMGLYSNSEVKMHQHINN